MSLKDDMEFGRMCCIHDTSKSDEERIYELEERVAGLEWAIEHHDYDRYMFIAKMVMVVLVIAISVQIGVIIGRVG